MEPSFLYAGVDAETREMARQLQELGGGDALLDPFDLHCIVDNRLAAGDAQVLWPYASSIGIRDASLPRSHPVAESTTYSRVTSTCDFGSVLTDPGAAPFVDKISDLALDGFNSCLIAYGGRNTGKSTAFFGAACPDNQSMQPCIVVSILRRLFTGQRRVSGSKSAERITIGLSAWALKGQQVIE